MSVSPEHILLVEDSPDISEFIIRQTLHPFGYRVTHVEKGSDAIQAAIQKKPDLIIANLDLSDISGKDLLVVLSSQGVETPVIVLAKEGMEKDIIQAFRLGALDYIRWPMQETEIVTVVERVMLHARGRREKEKLAHELEETNRQLQKRLRELTTILAIGKTVTSIKNLSELYTKVVEGAIYCTEADIGWLLIRQDMGSKFILKEHRNLPSSYQGKVDNTWDDSIISKIVFSKESLILHGASLEHYKVAQLGHSALAVPLMVRNEVAGILVVIRKGLDPFSKKNQVLLEAIADYASISLVNIKLLWLLDERSQSFEKPSEGA